MKLVAVDRIVQKVSEVREEIETVVDRVSVDFGERVLTSLLPGSDARASFPPL